MSLASDWYAISVARRLSLLTDALLDGPLGTPPAIDRESSVVVAWPKIEAAAVGAEAGSGTRSARAPGASTPARVLAAASAQQPVPRTADRPDNGMS
jgi:hypothetical protein